MSAAFSEVRLVCEGGIAAVIMSRAGKDGQQLDRAKARLYGAERGRWAMPVSCWSVLPSAEDHTHQGTLNDTRSRHDTARIWSAFGQCESVSSSDRQSRGAEACCPRRPGA